MGFLNGLFGSKKRGDTVQQNASNKGAITPNEDAESFILTAQNYEKSGDAASAIEWYTKAAERNHPIGLYKIGIYHKNSHEDSLAFKYLLKAANTGHGGACYFVAQYYMDGDVVPKDEQAAFNYYKRAAELGDEAGQAYLGMFYLDGIGTNPDDKSAFFWLSKCPDIDWSGLGLCKCYLFGKGTAKNLDKGIAILMDIAKPQSSNMFVKDARTLARECAKQGLPIPVDFLNSIEAADNRESVLLDELIATFDDSAGGTDDSDDVIDNIITLTDENGEDVNYEFLDLIEYDHQSFVVLLPMDEGADEVVILKVESVNGDQENYTSIDDDTLLNKVFSIFKEKNKDFLDFTD